MTDEYVLGFLFTSDFKQALLLRKAKPEWQKGLLNGIGGKIEKFDRFPLSAMHREFKEETSCNARFWSKFAIMCSDEWVVHCYASYLDQTRLTGYQGTEEEPVAAYEVDKLDTFQCVPNLLWLLPMAKASFQRDQPILDITFNEQST